MKNVIISVAIVIAVLGAVFSVRFAKEVQQSHQTLDQERYNRMVAEENLSVANTKLNGLETELERLQNKLKNTEKLLGETSAINDDLKARLDKAMQIKESLEQKLKELQNISLNGSPSNFVAPLSVHLG